MSLVVHFLSHVTTRAPIAISESHFRVNFPKAGPQIHAHKLTRRFFFSHYASRYAYTLALVYL